MGLGGRAEKWSLGNSKAVKEVAQGGVQGYIGAFPAVGECTMGDGSSIGRVPVVDSGKAEQQPQPLRESGPGALPKPQQQQQQEGDMPSKPVQATIHEVQPLIKDAGAVVVIEAASKSGDISSVVPKYKSVGPGVNGHDDRPGEKKPKTFFSPFAQQLLAASGPVIATVSSGMTSGFSAVLLPQLTGVDTTFPITEEEASWIASTAALPMAPGCLLGGLLMEKIGRRLTIILLCIPLALGWALESAAPDVLSLCLGRALTGLGVGLLGAPGMVYIGETSSPAHRGFLLAAVSLAVSLGVALSHLIGALLPWRTAAGIAAVVPLIAAILAFLSPESPLWLASRGKLKEAARVFRMLRGTGPEAEKELEALVSRGDTNEEVRLEEVIPGDVEKKGAYIEVEEQGVAAGFKRWLNRWGMLLRRPSFIKPFFIMNFFFFVQQWCGVNAVTFYTVDIFKATASGKSGANVDEYTATGLVDAARIVASILACILLRKCGRRPLATASGLVSAISLLALATFLMIGTPSENSNAPNGHSSLSGELLDYLQSNSTPDFLENSTFLGDTTDFPIFDSTILDNGTALPGEDLTFTEEVIDLATYVWAWAPVVCLVVYVIASTMGLIPLPWVMTGEVFPVAGRGFGSGATSCVGFLAFFSVVKTAPALFRGLGMGGAFCVYGAVVLIGTGLLQFCLPETKGRTLQEIEEAFGGSEVPSRKNRKKMNLEVRGEDGKVCGAA